MTGAETIAIPLQAGARTLWRIPRRLVRVGLDLDGVLSGEHPVVPPLPESADGWLVTSLPEAGEPIVRFAAGRHIAHVRQRYQRRHADLTTGFETWWNSRSGNFRSTIRRRAKRIADRSGGRIVATRYATPDELSAFHRIARPIAARTYQETLLGAALPGDRAFISSMLERAAADQVRAWTLAIGDRPVAYLYCEGQGRTLCYTHVGHDPDHADGSPGAVLHVEAFRDLFAERRFDRFDFTEGDGQHKRSMATGAVACCDLLLLRPTLANHLAVAALSGFDRLVTAAKQAGDVAAIAPLIRRVRRG